MLSEKLSHSGARPGPDGPRFSKQAGVSLIELMIGMALGVVVVVAMTTMYVESGRTRNENERINRQVESGRYALQLITADLQQAGYYDAFNPDPSAKSYLAPPSADPNPCDTTLSGLGAAIALPVQGYDSVTSSTPLTCLSDVKTGTDILVIRRSSNCVAGPTAAANCDAPVAGDYLFQSTLCTNEINAGTYFKLDTSSANLTLHQRNCTTLSNYHRLLVRIYFVANNNKPGDGVPTLKRAELGPTGFTIVPLVDGIEDMQIEYGLDLSPSSGTGATLVLGGDGIPDAMTANPDAYGSCSALTHPTCSQYWQSVVVADVHLLARNVQINPGYTDNKTYTMGLTAAGAPNTKGPYGNSYERHLYQSMVRLYNSDSRRLTQ